eukprot:109015_1
MSFYGSFGSQQQTEDTQESITNIDPFEESVYDYIPRFKDEGDDTLSLFDFEDESLFEEEDEVSQLLYKDESTHIERESMHDPLEFEEESQLNISPTPPSVHEELEEEEDEASEEEEETHDNCSMIVIPDNVIHSMSNKLVERQHYSSCNAQYNTGSWKSHFGARRFFMPLPNRRFELMHHHEIEQVLRKQLSHMMLPDPLSADFYCGVTQAREGKMWEGFGVPGPGHVYIAHSHYPKHNDGSPILPPGTLGKTAGFVSVHAPKSMLSKIQNIVCESSDASCNDYRELCRAIEVGYDHLMLVERCNASIFYVHEESRDRMAYATENGLINSRTQRDDMNIFNICLESRDQRLANLIQWLSINKIYRIFYCDKGRRLMYRIFVLFAADDAVFIGMLKLLCAKMARFATCDGAHTITAHDIEFGDELRTVLMNGLSSDDALSLFKLMIASMRSNGDCKYEICTSRLVCSLLSVCVKVSQSNDEEWCESYHAFLTLFDNDLSFVIPSNDVTKRKHKELNASPRQRWELLCDLCLAFGGDQIYELKSFWTAVSRAMWFYPSARLLASKHSKLGEQLPPKECANYNKRKVAHHTHNPYSYSTPQSMHDYVNTMRRWLAAFKQHQQTMMEKERQHQMNIKKQTARQQKYDQMLQEKRDKINLRFKQQFFKALKEKNVKIRKHGPPPPPPLPKYIPPSKPAPKPPAPKAPKSPESSQSSISDTASFLSLGIGLDPYDLNKKYYQNIMKNKTTWKLKKKKEEKKEEAPAIPKASPQITHHKAYDEYYHDQYYNYYYYQYYNEWNEYYYQNNTTKKREHHQYNHRYRSRKQHRSNKKKKERDADHRSYNNYYYKSHNKTRHSNRSYANNYGRKSRR